VFKAFGVQATIDDSVHFSQVKLDLDGASFEQATRILGLVTDTFYVPLDAHRVLVARDTVDNRKQFERLELETIYLPGLTATQINDMGTLAKTVFELTQSQVDPTSGTVTVRGSRQTLDAFNATVRQLIDGRNQVVLDVELIELAHTSARNTGIQPPQSVTAVNVYAEEQSILKANQALVQQIISSGLAAPGDTLAILGILLASGQVSSSLLTSGAALFGGGITTSALSPGSFTANFSLNTSKSRLLDHMELRLGDGEDGTVRSGTRYPIQTSSVSSGTSGLSKIAGLTGAGTSSSLSSLLGGLGGSGYNIPQIQYQDLGLTLKATPSVMRNGDVAMKVDLKIDALSGQSSDGNPILNSRSYQGVVTMKEGDAVEVVSELDDQQTRAISGLPGLSEIPGLNNATDKTVNKSGSTLVIVMTPHVVRGTQAAGHSPMMRVERNIAH
jgi:type II secretory pathway component GspD/PulD (secretin)